MVANCETLVSDAGAMYVCILWSHACAVRHVHACKTCTHMYTQGVPKAEIRKILRQQRQARWQQLMTSKPDDKYEDPADIAAIEYAQEHMGDYKLKTDPDYVVPEHLRINAEKKRRQMVRAPVRHSAHVHQCSHAPVRHSAHMQSFALDNNSTSCAARVSTYFQDVSHVKIVRVRMRSPNSHLYFYGLMPRC